MTLKPDSIDYDRYSLEDLESALDGINAEKYPENYTKLLRALERKRSEAPSEDSSQLKLTVVPKGFTSTLLEDGSIHIEYAEHFRTSPALILAVWLIAWAFGGASTFKSFGHSLFISLWIIAWCFGLLIAAKYFLWVVFGKISIHLTEDEMLFKKTLFSWEKTDVLHKSNIKRIYQIVDRKRDPETEPAWGLKIQTMREHYVLKCQEYDKSEWLGEVIAKWSGIVFEKAKKH